MGKPIKPQAGPVPGLRITCKHDGRVAACGLYFAGVSEVPAADFSAPQLVELKAHPHLAVEEIEITVPVTTGDGP